ncbi:hypothetical protein [Nocardiopsis sp. LOL_012]|uniref:hypothetical protein n=1 Tax=Nocardiopsis sp. LOL_012 TaxID=3345409 RepID=UPI003A87C26D
MGTHSAEVAMADHCPAGAHDWQQGPNGTRRCSRCGAISSRNYEAFRPTSWGRHSVQPGRHAAP